MKVEVSVRIRPHAKGDAHSGRFLKATEAGIAVGDKSFGFPSKIISGSNQTVAQRALATPLLARLQEGYSVALLAYGQTCSGKTYTMFGPPGSLTEASLAETGGEAPALWGIFPRSVVELLKVPGLGKLHASAN